MFTARDLLFGVLVPAAIAAAVLRLGRRSGFAAGGLALAAAYVAGQIGLRGVGKFPPVEAIGWLPYLAAGAAALCVVAPLAARRPALRRLAGLVLVVGGPVLLLRARIAHGWSTTESALWLGGLALVVLATWLELEWVIPSLPGASGWIVLTVVSTGSALALALSGSLLLGQLGAVCAAACLGGALVAVLARGHGFERSSSIVAAVLLPALLVVGYFYADLPAASAGLLVAAPLAAKTVPRSITERRGARTGALVQGVAAALPTALAVGLAFAASPPIEPYY